MASSFLPGDPRVEEPYRLTPRLALRVGLLGMVAVAIFTTLLLRLWSLQILNGAQLLRAAQNNQRRDVRVEAPRGTIVDRNGLSLVKNVPGTAVELWQIDLPKDRDARRVMMSLGQILRVPAHRRPHEEGAVLRRERRAVEVARRLGRDAVPGWQGQLVAVGFPVGFGDVLCAGPFALLLGIAESAERRVERINQL